MNSFKRCCFVLLISLLHLAGAACQKNVPVAQPVESPVRPAFAVENAPEIWESYLALAKGQPLKPVHLEGSLRYRNPKNDGHRVSFYLWSNGDYPYRLDLLAGFGSVAMSVREARGDFLAYLPKDKKAYAHKGSQTPRFVLPGLDYPFPLTLADLANLLQNRYASLFGTSYLSAVQASALNLPDLGKNFSGVAYTLDNGTLGGQLVLDANGRPVLWQEGDGQGWSILFGYAEEAERSPLTVGSAALSIKKLTISHARNYSAVLLLKECDYPATSYSEAQLALLLGSDVKMLPIARLQQK